MSRKHRSNLVSLIEFVERTLTHRNKHNPFREIPAIETVTDRGLEDSLLLRAGNWQAICSSKNDVKKSLKRLRESQNDPRNPG